MSITELTERLKLTKTERDLERRSRSETIIRDKRRYQEEIDEAVDRIARHRMARSRVAAAASMYVTAIWLDLCNTYRNIYCT